MDTAAKQVPHPRLGKSSNTYTHMHTHTVKVVFRKVYWEYICTHSYINACNNNQCKKKP